MHKLLITSQKGGVGKTTTALNLAATAARSGQHVLLLDADPLGGISASLATEPHDQGVATVGWCVWSSALPGVDVVTRPAEEVPAPEEWNYLLQHLSVPGLRQSYDLAIIDSPPGLGPRFAALLDACDEVLLVMRAEPLAYRTLPAALREMRAAREGDGRPHFRGILLTLPQGELPGGTAETAWRGQFGSALLPQVIPHDGAVGRAALQGRPVVLASPASAVARSYEALAEELNLLAPQPAAVPIALTTLAGESSAIVAATEPAGVPWNLWAAACLTAVGLVAAAVAWGPW